jgi:diguanylate cyclase (GGDEF)-like protein/PAS domain S-box-containing protein
MLNASRESAYLHALISQLKFASYLFLMLLICGSAQALTDSNQSQASSTPHAAPQIQKTNLIVGSEQDYPPFATGMTDATAGGFTVDLWRAVATEAGLTYQLRTLPFHQLLDEFKQGKIDVIINLAQSDERHHFADFTVPHVVVHGAIFVRKGETNIRSETDLSGKSIIVLNADLAHDYAISRGWGTQLVLVNTAAEGMRLLASGKHDAMLLGKLPGLQALQALELKNIQALPFQAGFAQKFSFAVHEGQSELLAKINEGLALSKSNGAYNALYEKYFGIYEEKQVGLRDLLAYLVPIILIFLGIAGYFHYQRHIERTESEKKYRDLYDHAPDMLMSIEACHGTIIDCNQTLLNNTGYTRQEVIGLSIFKLYHPDSAELARAAFQKFRTAKEIHGVQLQLRCWDGRIIDVSLSATAVCDKHGKILHSRSALHDITERKAAEAAIAESRNLLFTIIDTAPMRVFWKDRDLRFLGCNTAFAGDSGMTHPNNVIGKDDYQMGWAAQADLYRADDRAVMVSGIAKLFYDEPQTTPEGQTIWLRTSKIPLKNKDGETIGLLGIYEDITERKQAEEKLHTLYTAIEQSPISVIITSVDANIEYVNPHFAAVTGYSVKEAIGENPRMLQSGLTPREIYLELWDKLTSGQVWHGELINKRKNGEMYWEETHISPIKNGSGVLTHYVAAKVDITQRKQNEAALRQSEERFRFMLENSPIAVRITNMHTSTIMFANQRYFELIAVARDDVIGIDPKQYYANPQDYVDIIERLEKGDRVTNQLIKLHIPNSHSTTKWALASYLHLEFQNESAVLGWFYDITDRKLMEEQIKHLAHFDSLTDLPNRTLFTDRLQQALAIARRDKERLALMFIDLDKFKPINDRYGHHIGDLVLKEVALRIQACLRESDTVARIGGDEFVVLLPTIDARQDALIVAEKIRQSLNQPIRQTGQTLNISSSTGVALYPEHGVDETQLIRNADTAMYYAKATGRDTVKIFQMDMQEMS